MSESPHLTDVQLAAVRVLLDRVRTELATLAEGDQKTLHHARRYLMKRLEFDECGTPAERKKLKVTLVARQQGRCSSCCEPLLLDGSELKRVDPVLGFKEDNYRLVHHDCHRKAQAARNYS